MSYNYTVTDQALPQVHFTALNLGMSARGISGLQKIYIYYPRSSMEGRVSSYQ